MTHTVTVTRDDGTSGRFVLAEEHADGSLLLRPDTSYEAIAERAGGRTATREEFEQILGPHVRPPDGEG